MYLCPPLLKFLCNYPPRFLIIMHYFWIYFPPHLPPYIYPPHLLTSLLPKFLYFLSPHFPFMWTCILGFLGFSRVHSLCVVLQLYHCTLKIHLVKSIGFCNRSMTDIIPVAIPSSIHISRLFSFIGVMFVYYFVIVSLVFVSLLCISAFSCVW